MVAVGHRAPRRPFSDVECLARCPSAAAAASAAALPQWKLGRLRQTRPLAEMRARAPLQRRCFSGAGEFQNCGVYSRYRLCFGELCERPVFGWILLLLLLTRPSDSS